MPQSRLRLLGGTAYRKSIRFLAWIKADSILMFICSIGRFLLHSLRQPQPSFRRVVEQLKMSSPASISRKKGASLSNPRILNPRLVPVSYTHLRAHETRHDIVCRLLLEKKKK